MFTEMIIETEGELFYIDSEGFRDEITIKQAMNILSNWEQGGKQVEENVKYDGLVRQYWIW